MKNFPCSKPMDRVVFERGVSWMRRDARPFPILDDHGEPVEGIGDGSTRSEPGQLEFQIMQRFFGCQVTLSTAFSDVSWCPLWLCVSLVAQV